MFEDCYDYYGFCFVCDWFKNGVCTQTKPEPKPEKLCKCEICNWYSRGKCTNPASCYMGGSGPEDGCSLWEIVLPF